MVILGSFVDFKYSTVTSGARFVSHDDILDSDLALALTNSENNA